MPTGVGAVCSSSSFVPTVPSPSASAGATLIQQVFSARATRAGVANTSSVPLPMVFAVFSAVTGTLCSPRIPVSNVIKIPSCASVRKSRFYTFYKIPQLGKECTHFGAFCKKYLFCFLPAVL